MYSSSAAAMKGFCEQADLKSVFITGTYWSFRISAMSVLEYVGNGVIIISAPQWVLIHGQRFGEM